MLIRVSTKKVFSSIPKTSRRILMLTDLPRHAKIELVPKLENLKLIITVNINKICKCSS